MNDNLLNINIIVNQDVEYIEKVLHTVSEFFDAGLISKNSFEFADIPQLIRECEPEEIYIGFEPYLGMRDTYEYYSCAYWDQFDCNNCAKTLGDLPTAILKGAIMMLAVKKLV